jgi:hypothetical protein
MPFRSIRTTEPSSAEITTLEQIIASARNRLNGLAEEDPATRLLREHLAELIAKREALKRALEDKNYSENKSGMVFYPLPGLLGIALFIYGLTSLAEGSIAVGVFGLVLGSLDLAIFVPIIVRSWLDVREYRRIRAGEQPGSE